jgi:hypothetical protein
MEKLIERKITFLYSAMDSAYDATPVTSYAQAKAAFLRSIRINGGSREFLAFPRTKRTLQDQDYG